MKAEPVLSPRQLKLLEFFAQAQEGMARGSHIEKMTGLSKEEVKEVIAELVALGFIDQHAMN